MFLLVSTYSIQIHGLLERYALGAFIGVKPHDLRLGMLCRGVGRWFGKGGLYRSIGKGSMISVYKIESRYSNLHVIEFFSKYL